MSQSPSPALLSRLLAANRRYVEAGPKLPPAAAPSERVAVLTCMDVRIDPLAVLGLELGQAHVLRNAGARLTDDVLRSLVISQQALGTDTVILMPHTRCGVLGLDPATLRPRPDAPAEAAPHLDFHPMRDIAESLVADLRTLRESAWMPTSVQLIGLILDIDTGAVSPIPA